MSHMIDRKLNFVREICSNHECAYDEIYFYVHLTQSRMYNNFGTVAGCTLSILGFIFPLTLLFGFVCCFPSQATAMVISGCQFT